MHANRLCAPSHHRQVEDSFKLPRLLDRYFGGTLVQQVTWQGGDGSEQKSEHTEPFRVLPLEINGCATLQASPAPFDSSRIESNQVDLTRRVRRSVWCECMCEDAIDRGCCLSPACLSSTWLALAWPGLARLDLK